MLRHQKLKHVDAGDFLIRIMLAIVCLNERGEGFDEAVSAVFWTVADLVHQFTQLFYGGIVFARVSRNEEQAQFFWVRNPARDAFHLFHLPVSYSR